MSVGSFNAVSSSSATQALVLADMGGRRITRGAAIRFSRYAFRLSLLALRIRSRYKLNARHRELKEVDSGRCKNPSHVDDTEILSRGEESASERARRSEEHTSELQSLRHLVC